MVTTTIQSQNSITKFIFPGPIIQIFKTFNFNRVTNEQSNESDSCHCHANWADDDHIDPLSKKFPHFCSKSHFFLTVNRNHSDFSFNFQKNSLTLPWPVAALKIIGSNSHEFRFFLELSCLDFMLRRSIHYSIRIFT